MKVLICDDDKKIIENIKTLLGKISADRSIDFEISAFTNGNEIDNSKFDLAFVDIEMPEIDGLSVCEHIKENNPNVIIFIVTSFPSYLDDAMALNVFRYLSKPIDSERFMKNVGIAIELWKNSTHNFVIESGEETVSVFTRDILYVTIEKRKACIALKDRKIRTNQSFDYWKKALSPYDYFALSHYSYLVNLKSVTRLSKTDATISCDGKELDTVPISRRYYNSFKHSFYKYIGVTV